MTRNKLNSSCIQEAKTFYDNGRGLRSTELKNYTSGDHMNPGMESVVESIIWKVIDHMGIERKRVQVNAKYFNPDDTELQDPQRMDFHVWIDNEVPVVIESRAWIDKPFYQLKRAVVRNFMTLEYVREHLAEDPKFIFVGLCIDIKDRLRHTNDRTMGFGQHIYEIKLSPYRRGYKKKNYFDHGFRREAVEQLVELLVDSFQPYKENT